MPDANSDRVWQQAIEPLANRADFIRAACVLEATAPKAGNVHPGARFDDLTFDHFVTAADCTARELANLRSLDQLGPSIWSAVQATRSATQTNVNLGIILLLGPLLASEPGDAPSEIPRETPNAKATTNFSMDWQQRLTDLLDQLTPKQGGWIAQAIAAADAGGMDTSEVDSNNPLDVTQLGITTDQPAPYDIVAAMRAASNRDQIAGMYATGFADLFEVVVPTIHGSVDDAGGLMPGLVLAQIRLLARWGDSLIGRKCGPEKSSEVQQRAAACLKNYSPNAIKHLDDFLRSDRNRLNPGTTADLLAAGLYVCLRRLPKFKSPKPHGSG
ncbi:triphosphoribosyl-dephospho-CoA synthase [Neorhodopirellula lusitana]|uniref:triphosphoribosyl-dephospho-CoA synthase n=1 Tax=Neorhodopirellula lusitana TaxID=445327 RepID=UPI00384C13CA